MAVLFLDLQKTFDTVDHKILLQKLYHYGIRGNSFRILKSYLSGRYQRTQVKSVLSSLASVLWGVPQGSVLGPLLFLIYINDLPNVSDLMSWLFADDTALALSADNFKDLEIKLNNEVEKVHNWLLANKLSVHYTDKTQFMLIKAPNLTASEHYKNFKLYKGIHQIEQTDNYKYLGIMVDNKLNWKLQIKSICSKLSSVCGVISKVRHYLDKKALMLIYNSLFDSRLRYAVLGWGTASNQEISNSGSYRTELSDLLISLLFEPLWPRSILILRYSPLIKFSFFKKMSICTTYTTIIYRLRLVHIVTNQRIGI